MSTPISYDLNIDVSIDNLTLALIKAEGYPKHELSYERFHYGEVAPYANIFASYEDIVAGMSSVTINSPSWVKEAVSSSGFNGDNLLVRESHDSRFFGLMISVTPTPFAPVIIRHPVNTIAVLGETITLSCVATGSPAPTIQWQADGVDIPGATSDDYTFEPLASDSGITYTAVVTNPEGTVTSDGAVLRVVESVVIDTQPIDVTVHSPLPATFTSVASGNPIPTVQWQYNGNQGGGWLDIADATSDELVIDPTAENMNGYSVRAVWDNYVSTLASDVVTLNVDKPISAPSFDVQPDDVTVNAPDSATFTVSGSGYPAPTIQWQLDGVDIPGETSETLVIDPTSVAMDGTGYKAVLTNIGGTASSDEAVLTVEPELVAPTVDVQPVATEVVEPAPATFTVSGSGYPAPTIQWQLDGVDIPGETSETLEIDPTSVAMDGGLYQAVLTNSSGSVTSDEVLLTVTV